MKIWATFTYKKISSILKNYGCKYMRTSWSHEIWYNPKDNAVFVVVHHKNESMKIGTLKSMIEQSKIPEEYFLKMR